MKVTEIKNLSLNKAIELGYEPKNGDPCVRLFRKNTNPCVIKEFIPKQNQTECDLVKVEDTITHRQYNCSTNIVYKKFKVTTEVTPE